LRAVADGVAGRQPRAHALFTRLALHPLAVAVDALETDRELKDRLWGHGGSP
jgi:hypothetical protein